MVTRVQEKPRALSRLQKLSLASRRRMGLEDEPDEKQVLLRLFKALKASLQKKIDKMMVEAIDEMQKAPKPAVSGLLVSTGLRSTPPSGSKKVRNLYVTPAGLFHVDYEDNPA